MESFYLYIIVKYFAYVLVCAVAPKFLLVDWDPPMRKAAFWGVVRLVIGFVFGLLSLLFITIIAATVVKVTPSELITYLILLMMPVRWIEWSMLISLIYGNENIQFTRGYSGLFLGANKKERSWITIGVLVSSGLDAVVYANMPDVSITSFKFFC